ELTPGHGATVDLDYQDPNQAGHYFTSDGHIGIHSSLLSDPTKFEDVLLHELGHKASDVWYGYLDPPISDAIKAEIDQRFRDIGEEGYGRLHRYVGFAYTWLLSGSVLGE